MSQDRIIHFNPLSEPSRVDLFQVLEDYLGDAGVVVERDENWFEVTLQGHGSFPFKRQPNFSKGDLLYSPHPRFFEVFLGSFPDHISIVTRSADEYTSNVATGYAKLVARFWKGDLDGV